MCLKIPLTKQTPIETCASAWFLHITVSHP